FPGDASGSSPWRPLGAAKTLDVLAPFQQGVLEWDWALPPTAGECVALLAVIDSSSDPIPAASKQLEVAPLVAAEKRVALKAVHPIDLRRGTVPPVPLRLEGQAATTQTIQLTVPGGAGGQVGLVLRKSPQPNLQLTRLEKKAPTKSVAKALGAYLGGEASAYDTSAVYWVVKGSTDAELAGLSVPEGGAQAVLVLAPASKSTLAGTVTVRQLSPGQPGSGSTYILLPQKKTAQGKGRSRGR